jgi:ABC-2 type transport system permease protein
MMNAIRAEWIKVRTITSTWVLAIVAVSVTALFALIGVVFNNDNFSIGTVFGVSIFMPFLLGTVGVLIATTEYRFTIRPTLSANANRIEVFGAKAVVTAITTAISTSVSLLITLGLFSIKGIYGFSISRVIGFIIFSILMSLLGLGMGLLLKNTALAVVLLIGWPLVLDTLLVLMLTLIGRNGRGDIYNGFTRWLFPFKASGSLYGDTFENFSQITGGIYFAVFVAAFCGFGALAFQKRDAS